MKLTLWSFNTHVSVSTIAVRCGVVFALFTIPFLISFKSPVSYSGFDSRGTLLVSQSILESGTVSLSQYPEAISDFGYRIKEIRGKQYYFFPIGPSLVATPAVWIARHFGFDMRQASDDVEVQRYLSAICVGMCVLLVFVLCRRYLTNLTAILLALGVALGTPMASTVGTAFWSIDTALVFMLLALIWGLPHNSTGPLYPRLAGAALFFAFLCRPTAVALIIPLYAFLALKHWGFFRRAAIVSLVLLGGLSLWSLGEYGQILPPYYMPARVAANPSFWTAVFGNLFSPSRGLLVCSPLLTVFLAYSLYRIRLVWRMPEFLIGLFWFAFHLVAISRFPHWWGGHGYLARLMCEAVLPLLLIIIASCRSIKKWDPIFLSVCIVGGLVGVAIHIPQGMYNVNTKSWNSFPNVDLHPETIFDWGYPQFLATEDRNQYKYDSIIDSSAFAPGIMQFRKGWAPNENWGRWALKKTAVIRVYNVALPTTLRFKASSWESQTEPQECRVLINNKEASSFTIQGAPWTWQDYKLPIQGKGTKTLDIEFRFEHLFPDKGGAHRLRALPVSDIQLGNLPVADS